MLAAVRGHGRRQCWQQCRQVGARGGALCGGRCARTLVRSQLQRAGFDIARRGG